MIFFYNIIRDKKLFKCFSFYFHFQPVSFIVKKDKVRNYLMEIISSINFAECFIIFVYCTMELNQILTINF